MSARIRNLAVMLLVLVLPWQPLAAGAMPTAFHHHGAIAVDASAATPHDANTHYTGHQHHEHDGATLSQDQGPGSNDTAHDTCTDACCSPALAADSALPLVAVEHRGSAIPFATHRLPSRAPDSLERPPRNLLA
jgi:hypothetical protein